MKILKRWIDERYGAENTIYELPSGTRLLHTVDMKTVDSIFSIYSSIGSLYNDILKVKSGTAHFLEHILAGNPNRIFQTKKQIDHYEFGTKKYPKINSNAWTSRLGVTFHGSTNTQGEHRLVKRIGSMIDVDAETFDKYIEKERKIILAEIGQRDKPEKDGTIQFFEFVFNNLPNEYKKYPLGSESDVEGISKEDLVTFFKHIFNSKSVILSLQSSQKISNKTMKELERIDRIIAGNNTVLTTQPSEKIENKFMFKHFYDEKARSISIEFEAFEKTQLKQDYRNRILRIFSYDLVNYLIFEELREKKGYIYSSEKSYINSLLNNYAIRGIIFSTDIKNFKKALNSYQKILESGVEKFLNSKSGKKWLESQISRVVFPNTVSFDDDYARSIASNYLMGFETYEYEKLRKEALKVTDIDIRDYISQNILNTPHIAWITSDKEDGYIEKEFIKTDVYKYQSKLKPISPL